MASFKDQWIANQKRRMHPEQQLPPGATGELTNYDPSWRDRLADLMGTAANKISGKPYDEARRDSMTLLGLAPGTGTAMAAEDAARAAKAGDWRGAALAGLGAIPEIGPEARALAAGERGAAKVGREELAQLAAPAVQTKGNQPLIDKIFAHAEQQRSPDYPPATDPVFGPADPELTKQLVPQRSVAGELPPMPTGDVKLPKNDRARGIFENQQALGDLLASDLTKMPTSKPPFYSTGSVLAGLEDRAGLRPQEALDFMGDWSGQGAATSPRTATPQNLRNASLLMFERGQGNPLTSARREAEGNRPGFAMMGMHTDLADQFAKGTVDPWQNSKPYTFQQNWMGNMEDPTVDTHNIRKVLDAYDRLNPGGLPKEWFTSPEAFDVYKQGGGFPKEGKLPVGDIEDRMGSAVVPGTGRKAQMEYPLFQSPNRIAAQKLGITPAEAQERLWFEGGPRTGLRSPEVTIPDLLNSQIEATAKATGMSPEAIMRLWAKRAIPLASNEPDTNMPGASATG
ncbi:hypothetical protein NKG99_20385 [Mesorhizobium sp. M1409]|uniref:hypothetical protein n=1 Tax=Mesorhizobium sp. M1409 TaxID=2957100 RepID=UPI003339FCB1